MAQVSPFIQPKVLSNGHGGLIFIIDALEGEPVEPILCYAGQSKAILRRQNDEWLIIDIPNDPKLKLQLACSSRIRIVESDDGNGHLPQRNYDLPVRFQQSLTA